MLQLLMPVAFNLIKTQAGHSPKSGAAFYAAPTQLNPI
jgi:hypothetical protein